MAHSRGWRVGAMWSSWRRSSAMWPGRRRAPVWGLMWAREPTWASERMARAQPAKSDSTAATQPPSRRLMRMETLASHCMAVTWSMGRDS